MTKSQQRFMKLPRMVQRVRIARDVLRQLKLGTITAQRGTYLRVHAKKALVGGTPAEQVFSNTEACFVCAIGAASVAAARLGNRLALHEDDIWSDDNTTAGFNDAVLREQLAPFFTYKELWLIEGCFELNSRRGSSKWLEFAADTEDDEALRLLMKSIVLNAGKLKLPTSEAAFEALRQARVRL